MTSTITIGDRDIAMTANAATCYRYKQVFKKDLFQIFKTTEQMDISAIQELAYVMMHQAAGTVEKMNFDDYMIWLEEFDALDFAHASAQIVNVYANQQKTTAAAKKKVNEQTGQ